MQQVLQDRGGALRRDARERHEGAGGRAHARGPDARRRDRFPALRHVRLPGRSHRRHRARARRARRLRRLRGGDGAPARARAGGVEVPRGGGRRVSGKPTEFHGYDTLTLEGTVVAIYKEGAQLQEIGAGEAAVVVLDRTPFYAESGGQVGDRASSPARAARSSSRTRRRSRPEVFGHKGGLKAGQAARRRQGDGRRRRGSPARARRGTTRRPTSCTRRCARCSARTCSRRARSSIRTRRASTSRTTSR